ATIAVLKGVATLGASPANHIGANGELNASASASCESNANRAASIVVEGKARTISDPNLIRAISAAVIGSGAIFVATDSGTTKTRSAKISAVCRLVSGWGKTIKGYSFRITTPTESVKYKTDNYVSYEIISSQDKM